MKEYSERANEIEGFLFQGSDAERRYTENWKID